MNINQTMTETEQLTYYEGALLLLVKGTPADDVAKALMACLKVSSEDVARAVISAELSDTLHLVQASKRKETAVQKAKNFKRPILSIKTPQNENSKNSKK